MVLHHATNFPENNAPRIDATNGPKHFSRILGVHANGHDASVAIVENGELVELIEFERIFREKHCRLNVLHPRFEHHIRWLFEDYGLSPEFDAVALHLHYFGSEPREYHHLVQDAAVKTLSRYVGDAHFLQLSHHLCHAASGYFASPFDEAIVLSIDGHGNDGSSLGFVGRGSSLDYAKGWPFSLGRAYSALANIVGGIHAKDGNAAGKVMGLTAYGSVRPEWKDSIRKFILGYTGIRSEFSPLYWEASIADGVFSLPGYGVIEGKEQFGGPDDPLAQDFAATYQEVWSEVVQEMVRELIHEHGISNVCLVGGCALNAATNYDVAKMPEVTNAHFVPHPNDCGISAGAALYAAYGYQGKKWEGASASYQSPYIGVPILDRDTLEAVAVARNAVKLSHPAQELAQYIANGSKVGVMNGRSEIGPRALGNRSIIADPRNPKQKDIINETIKFREWYRPFAPMVRENEAHRYFDVVSSSPYMSLIAPVREEWRDRLPAITHSDGSARVQTISEEQNPFIWQLLLAFEEITGVGVLLNTSLNGPGEPVHARISELLALLDRTDLDAAYVEEYFFE